MKVAEEDKQADAEWKRRRERATGRGEEVSKECSEPREEVKRWCC